LLLLGQPADCTGGEELVVETPRGTLVDVTVPVSIAPVSAGAPQRSIAVLYHPNPHAAIPTPTTPMTPVLLTSPPKGKKTREG
jgi:predicted secreted protein